MIKQFPNPNSIMFKKFKKFHKVNDRYMYLLDKKRFYPLYGEYGIQAVCSGKLTFKQIESCRRSLRRALSKYGLFWIRCLINAPVSKKPSGLRMGKGKGAVSYWIATVSKGQVIFEIDCSSDLKAHFVLDRARVKLPFKTKIIKLKY